MTEAICNYGFSLVPPAKGRRDDTEWVFVREAVGAEARCSADGEPVRQSAVRAREQVR